MPSAIDGSSGLSFCDETIVMTDPYNPVIPHEAKSFSFGVTWDHSGLCRPDPLFTDTFANFPWQVIFYDGQNGAGIVVCGTLTEDDVLHSNSKTFTCKNPGYDGKDLELYIVPVDPAKGQISSGLNDNGGQVYEGSAVTYCEHNAQLTGPLTGSYYPEDTAYLTISIDYLVIACEHMPYPEFYLEVLDPNQNHFSRFESIDGATTPNNQLHVMTTRNVPLNRFPGIPPRGQMAAGQWVVGMSVFDDFGNLSPVTNLVFDVSHPTISPIGGSCTIDDDCVQTPGVGCWGGRCTLPIGSNCTSDSMCRPGVGCPAANFCPPPTSPDVQAGCDDTCSATDALVCGGIGATCTDGDGCQSGRCVAGQCASTHPLIQGCYCTYAFQCDSGLSCNGECFAAGTLASPCASSGDCMSPLSCAGGVCGGLGATCQTDNGAQLNGYSAEDCVSGYCLYGGCSPGYPVGHTCSSSNDCALPVGAASGGQPVQCSSGTCGGYGAYCPVNTQNSDSTTSWCSSGLACVNYQCALAASGGARKRKRLQQQMQTSLSRTWQQQQLDSTESCGDGSIRCPTGGAPGAFECIHADRNLESCGGCPGLDGIDCSALANVGQVRCVAGQCLIDTCMTGFTMCPGNGTCVAE